MAKIAELKKPDEVPKLTLRCDELARAMGISVISVRRLVKNTDIPKVRLPGSRVIIFPLAEVQEWLSRQVTKGGEANG
ncbi:helix-turn-helix transcriptional regulator [Tuwongella immobilis]|uniref:: HTH_17 n=1 Tax=Tuwongella immobilis TaxID=692036 RepID=A0A6C2YWP7_9BACT|nr:helix-turn-helix domain-containing protein [Tuwongella immobilis]VIP05573.1 : HTH_17 [Tuwongella immobilis]VTS08501.1 : HTH_17 [Tuwongella immobilis]